MEVQTATQPFEAAWPETVEGQLAIDVFETENELVIQSAIAGVQPDELDIFINPDMVTIRGVRQRDKRAHDSTTHYEECFWGSFSRTVVLPCHVQSDRSTADIKNGVLTITMPKQSHAGNKVEVMKS
jgi:HSP20 family protein